MKVLVDRNSEKYRSFRAPQRVLDWIGSEILFWKWAREADFFGKNELSQLLNRVLASAKNTIESALEKGKSDVEQSVDQALSSISNMVRAGKYHVSSSPFAQYLDDIRKEDEVLAACSLYLSTIGDNKQIPSVTPLVMKAASLLTHFELGIDPKGNAANKKVLSGLSSRYEALVSQAEIGFENTIGRLETRIAKKDQRSKTSITTLARWIKSKRSKEAFRSAKHLQELSEMQNAAEGRIKEELVEFRDKVEQQIALQAPVKYWIHKRSNHCVATWIIGGVFLLYSIFLIHIVTATLARLNLKLDDYIKLPQEIGFEGLAGIVIVLAISLIFSRILYRLFASQLHLWNDASERVTMIQTYLALAIRGHAKEEHMEALIQRLFKPASDGVVRDDLGSINGLDATLSKFRG